MTLTGRIDRIDQLDDGGQVLIDYKTGRVSINDWVGERPDAPQLPLYAVNRDTFPDVVAFARIKNGENRFEGLAVEEELLVDATIFKEWKNCPDGLEKWTDLEQYWRVNLAELGRQFAAGVAAVDPKIANKSCKYCHLSTLCRIDEKSQSRRGFSGETDDE